MGSPWGWLRPGHLGTEADRATFRTLHTASLAAPPLRSGLTDTSATKAIRHLRDLLGTPAVALTDTERLLAWDGRFGHHGKQAPTLAEAVVAEGSTSLGDKSDIPCYDPTCPLRHVIVSPLTVEERVVGTLQAFTSTASASLVRATNEVARWVSGQLELAELDASRTRLMEAEVRALLRETAEDGRTVFLSSHSLDEVQHVADRVGIIRTGRLIDVDAVERLRERSLRHVSITFGAPVDATELAGLDGVRVTSMDGPLVRLSAPETAMDAIVKAAARHEVVDLVSQPADLEEIFLELYREDDDVD